MILSYFRTLCFKKIKLLKQIYILNFNKNNTLLNYNICGTGKAKK
jgi:hypothetical protein